MENCILPTFYGDLEHPSQFIVSYYDKLVGLVKLGALDFGIPALSREHITTKALNRYLNDPNSVGRREPGKSSNKLSGVIAAEHFRQEIEKVLRKHNAPYKISQNNAFIQGCRIEFDFLILKQDAQALLDIPVYRRKDVVAVLECKANGVYEYKQSSLERLFQAYFLDLDGCSNGIKIGYMTISENCPQNEAGRSNFIYHTVMDFKRRFENRDDLWHCFFARCHYTAKKPDRFMSDGQWEQFVLSLLPNT